MIIDIVVGMLVVLAALNTWVSWRTAQDDLATPAQRAAQIAVIWVLPVLGALLVLKLQRQDTEPHTGRYAGRPDPGDDDAASGGSYRRTRGALDNSEGDVSSND